VKLGITHLRPPLSARLLFMSSSMSRTSDPKPPTALPGHNAIKPHSSSHS